MQYIRSFKRPREIISNRKAGWRTQLKLKESNRILVYRNITSIKINTKNIIVESLFHYEKDFMPKDWVRWIAFHHEQKKEKGFLNV